MIIINLKDSATIEALHPAFKPLFDYLKSHNLLDMPLGRKELDGERLFINNDNPTLLAAEEQRMEVHRRYIDVHIPLDHDEILGWKSTHLCHDLSSDYEDDKDRMFYNDRPSTYVTLHPGEVCICYPEDAHAPIIGCGSMRKAVAKVMVESEY